MSREIIIPPGKYFIGDPCYCFDNVTWGIILDESDSFLEYIEYPNGEVIVAFRTEVGDGVFFDKTGRMYSVDSGLIGVVPVSRATLGVEESLGRVVEFSNFVICSVENGILSFGPYEIDTNHSYEDVEDECA